MEGIGDELQKDLSADLQPGLLASRRGKSGYSASMERSRSYGDGHGYIVHRHEDNDVDLQRKAGNVSGGKDEERGDGEGEKEYEVQWDGEKDPMNPRNLGLGRKWIIVLVVSLGSTCVTCTSSMYTLTYEQITVEFGVSRVVATLGLSLFVMGLGLGPMFLGQLC